MYIILKLFYVYIYIGIGGLGDMKHICGIIVVEERDKLEKEGKVCLLYFI